MPNTLHCSLVTDVTGVSSAEAFCGTYRARVRARNCAALSPQQHRFLGLWLNTDPERVRTSWQAQGRTLGPILDLDAPPPGADAVLAYRLSDGGHTFKGAAELRCVLPIADLIAFVGCWSVPLRALNDVGVALATAPGPRPLVGRSFKLEAALDRRFAAKASATGVAASDVLRGLVSRWVDGNEGPHD